MNGFGKVMNPTCLECHVLDKQCETICLLENLGRYSWALSSLLSNISRVEEKIKQNEKEIVELAILVEHYRRNKADIDEDIDTVQDIIGSIRGVLAAKEAADE